MAVPAHVHPPTSSALPPPPPALPLLLLLTSVLAFSQTAAEPAATMFTRHGLPLAPFGAYTFEPPAAETSSVANTKRGTTLWMGSLHWQYSQGLPTRTIPLQTIHAWLDRCDAVGTSVLYDLSSLARPTAGFQHPSEHGIENVTSCDKCFELIEEEVWRRLRA